MNKILIYITTFFLVVLPPSYFKPNANEIDKRDDDVTRPGFFYYVSGKNTDIFAPPLSTNNKRIDGLYLSEFQRENGAKYVISGGLLSSYSPAKPLGFLKVKGAFLSPGNFVKKTPPGLLDSAICVSKDAKLRILDATGWAPEDWHRNTGQYNSCLQSGPTLIRNGNPIPAPQSSDQKVRMFLWKNNTLNTFICESNDATTIIGIYFGTTEETINILNKRTKNFPGCKNAVRLTGGGTGGIITDKGDKYGYDSILPDAIGLW
ncbi:phosphodiester glycosidase family protein [Nitrospirillum bahiense]|uniref:Uncharacterized protein DUF2233 n=1 Tax=Nitrospirillum amazonense TaxID=28077 RepID=A0A560G1C9_9PROT|nr:phosphodiester glycosidase family protein [Nitrospirillum amazonense]TWB27698.1 uncharacterized protein DUF2233 [Nitrospirillum amazonense]